MPRPRGIPKTGGRKKGVGNKERIVVPEVLPPETAESIIAETARAMVLASSPVRTPKAVILDAMMRFEALGLGFLTKADRLMKRNAGTAKVAEAAQEGHRYIVAAVECATKAAPYVHARLLAVESRGDMTQDQAPFVVRVPAVMADSTVWQAAVGSAILDMEAEPSPVVRSNEVAATLMAPNPPPAPVASPVPLMLDPKTSRITAMPPGPATVRPMGTEEWLQSIKKVG